MSSDVSDWWRTAIIDMEPGRIALRGHPVEELIGRTTFPQAIWLMLRGALPSDEDAALVEATLVAGVDHGPQAPSVAAARMAITCGVGVNNALATGVNMLGDVHGGAGEQAVELYRMARDTSPAEAVATWRETRGRIVPGFGHRFHKDGDPRAPRLMALLRRRHPDWADRAEAVEAAVAESAGRLLPMNIDGATAAIHAALGFDGPASRGLFCLSRSVGLLAHVLEQKAQGGRNKGPTPPGYRWTHDSGGQEGSGS